MELEPSWPAASGDVVNEMTSKLRDPLEVINSGSRLKLKADPANAMALICSASQTCLRHHPTLALSTWLSTIAAIRMALADLEDIYAEAKESQS